MKYVVCVKQVPDTTEVEIDPETGTIIREGVPTMLNPFDEFALNEALRLRGETGGEVTALSMGPPQAEEALKKCLAIGADRAVLLSDRAFAGSDTWATGLALSRAVEALGEFHFVFCGLQATDGDTAQVGPEMARLLGIPQVTYVLRVEEAGEKKAVCLRETDEGYERIQVKVPALITCVSPADFQPIIPKMGQILKARKKPLETWDAGRVAREDDRFGLEGSPTQVIRTYPPPAKKGGGTRVEGTPEETVEAILKVLEKEGYIQS